MYSICITFRVLFTEDLGMDDWLIDINDLSQQLKIPPKTIRNKLSDGTWPLVPVRIGRALRWRQAEVDRLKRGETPGAGTDEA